MKINHFSLNNVRFPLHVNNCQVIRPIQLLIIIIIIIQAMELIILQNDSLSKCRRSTVTGRKKNKNKFRSCVCGFFISVNLILGVCFAFSVFEKSSSSFFFLSARIIHTLQDSCAKESSAFDAVCQQF